jgi:2-keto-4-pentenoate hydratase
MVINHHGQPVSTGCGAACMGNPLTAAVWLARTMARYKMPMIAGDVILTGALGPMVPVNPGDNFVAAINGVGSLTAIIGDQ